MKAGIELNKLVAEKVLGLTICQCNEDDLRTAHQKAVDARLKDPFAYHYDTGFFRFNSNNKCNFCGLAYLNVLEYSTNITRAWDLVEKLKMSVHAPKAPYAHGEYANNDIRWMAEVLDSKQPDAGYHYTSVAYGDTAAHAICLAALASIGLYEQEY